MAADTFELGERSGDEASDPIRARNAACERFQLDLCGEVVGMTSVGAGVLGRIAAPLAEEHSVGRRSHVADFAPAFSHVPLMFVVRRRCAVGVGAKRAAR